MCSSDEMMINPSEYDEDGTLDLNVNNIVCISNNICNAITSWKQIDLQMSEMKYQFDAFCKQLDANLEMYKVRAPMVYSQLNLINDMMTKILDKVLTMSTETDKEIDDKMRMMDSVDKYVDRITTMMIKLL